LEFDVEQGRLDLYLELPAGCAFRVLGSGLFGGSCPVHGCHTEPLVPVIKQGHRCLFRPGDLPFGVAVITIWPRAPDTGLTKGARARSTIG
jgi:hypothetical protein